MSGPIVFLSDLGLRDEFVGVCHLVIARIAPDARVVDLSHGVPPHDVQNGALVLRDGMPSRRPDAIGLAVVDPGSGTDRLAIAVRDRRRAALVGPDNGLLSLAWAALGGATAPWRSTRPRWASRGCPRCSTAATCSRRRPPCCAGVPLEPLGDRRAASIADRRSRSPTPRSTPGRIAAVILEVDRFGNVRLNVAAGRPRRGRLHARDDGRDRVTHRASVRARRVVRYSDVRTGRVRAAGRRPGTGRR